MATEKTLRQGYHDLIRRDILEMIPTTAINVLDLGCGTGALGKALKARQTCRVAGVELNKDAAAIAAKSLDKVYCDNLNRLDLSIEEQRYDCLILGDILEHLVAPWQVLKKMVGTLLPDATVIASVPNIAHPWIISQLQKGLFRYEPAGILDVTHLRFFTKTTIGQLFYKAGLKITSIKPVPSASNPIQYYVTAVKPQCAKANPVATIVILTRNNLQLTKECLKSIVKNTTLSHKVVVIDNGSTDGTVEYLRQYKCVYHIENDHNLGFARGFNVGLECIDTPFFVILNNDTAVTHKWLSNMLYHLGNDDKLMAVGPCSNNVSGPQHVAGAIYAGMDGLQSFADDFRRNCGNGLTYFDRLVFFCTLFRSEVLSTIGLLDEQFEQGNFEDDDYCMRIKQRGGKTAIVDGVFVHHAGGATFKSEKIDYAQAMARNGALFNKKWGRKPT